jgi:hypothetical protein
LTVTAIGGAVFDGPRADATTTPVDAAARVLVFEAADFDGAPPFVALALPADGENLHTHTALAARPVTAPLLTPPHPEA